MFQVYLVHFLLQVRNQSFFPSISDYFQWETISFNKFQGYNLDAKRITFKKPNSKFLSKLLLAIGYVSVVWHKCLELPQII